MATRCPARTPLSISSRGVCTRRPSVGRSRVACRTRASVSRSGQGPEDGRRGGVIPQRGEQVLSQGMVDDRQAHGRRSLPRTGVPFARWGAAQQNHRGAGAGKRRSE